MPCGRLKNRLLTPLPPLESLLWADIGVLEKGNRKIIDAPPGTMPLVTQNLAPPMARVRPKALLNEPKWPHNHGLEMTRIEVKGGVERVRQRYRDGL